MRVLFLGLRNLHIVCSTNQEAGAREYMVFLLLFILKSLVKSQRNKTTHVQWYTVQQTVFPMSLELVGPPIHSLRANIVQSLCKTKRQRKGSWLIRSDSFFQNTIQHCFTCRPSDSRVTERSWDQSNPGLLQCLHWQSDALIIEPRGLQRDVVYLG